MTGMIDVHLWLAFVVAAAVLAILPGPVVVMVISRSLAHGARTGLRVMAGAFCGTGILFAIGGLGLTWVLTFLEGWFDVLRWAGAAYLIYAGFRQWHAKPQLIEVRPTARCKGPAVFLQGFIVAVTNPKTIVFYAAFLPQFMDPGLPSGTQLFVLSVTFLFVVNCIDLAYVLLADRLRLWLVGERRGRIRNRIAGALLMGAGTAMAFMAEARR